MAYQPVVTRDRMQLVLQLSPGQEIALRQFLRLVAGS